MSDSKYTIQEVVDQAGISRRTLRYYIAQGVLMPPVGNGRKARYTDEHLDRVAKVRKLQEEGLTLVQIRDGVAPEAGVLRGRPGETNVPPGHGWVHLPTTGELLILLRADLPEERAEIIKKAAAAMMASLDAGGEDE
jgi:DNA-binding transcriptional MerR regulator